MTNQLTRVAKCDETREGEALFEASLASDLPYMRDGYREILTCTPAAVNLERAADGLPLLLHHDSRLIAGRVHGVRADGRRVRGRLKFFDTAAGRDAASMVASGHRELSVGYRIDRSRDTPNGDVVATKWTLLEASVVGVPADSTIGISRNHMNTEQDLNRDDEVADQHLSRSQRRAAAAATTGEADRQRAIVNLAATNHLPATWARGHINSGASLDEVAPDLLRTIADRQANTERVYAPAIMSSGNLGDSARGAAGRYDLTRALLAQVDPSAYARQAGFEAEYSRELARSSPLPTSGMLVPMATFFRSAIQKRAMDYATPTSGGNWVPELIDGSMFIDALRARSVVMKLGATVLQGLTGPTILPKSTAVTTVGWLTETEAAAETTPTTGGPSLTPHRVGAYSDVSKQVLMGAALDLQQLVTNDLQVSIMAELDRCALVGTGADEQPLGIKGTSSVGTVIGGTDGATLTWAHILGLESAVDTSNAMQNLGAAAYAINPSVRSFLKKTAKVSGDPQGLIMGDVPNDAEGLNSLNGYRCAVSGKLPANLEKGTSGAVCSLLMYGDWSQLVVAFFGGSVEVIVDPYTLAKNAQLRIVANLFADVAVRHPQSFAFMADAKLT